MKYYFCVFVFLGVMHSCKKTTPILDDNMNWHSRMVTATAYNSLGYQTDTSPNITAFGDTLRPGMRCIAVSRDLIRLGLKHNTPVVIEGFEGVFLVKDKMHVRWRNKIDIYMGNDVKAAKNWGRQRVCIDYGVPNLEY